MEVENPEVRIDKPDRLTLKSIANYLLRRIIPEKWEKMRRKVTLGRNALQTLFPAQEIPRIVSDPALGIELYRNELTIAPEGENLIICVPTYRMLDPNVHADKSVTKIILLTGENDGRFSGDIPASVGTNDRSLVIRDTHFIETSRVNHGDNRALKQVMVHITPYRRDHQVISTLMSDPSRVMKLGELMQNGGLTLRLSFPENDPTGQVNLSIHKVYQAT